MTVKRKILRKRQKNLKIVEPFSTRTEADIKREFVAKINEERVSDRCS